VIIVYNVYVIQTLSINTVLHLLGAELLEHQCYTLAVG